MEFVVIKNSKSFKRLKEGHLWLFANELSELPDLPNGSLVKIVDRNGSDYGVGFYNRNSLISVRLLQSSVFNSQLITERIHSAYAKRKLLLQGENSFRTVFGESDLLPGLIIDKYADYWSVQILSAGMELFKSEIIESLLLSFPTTKGIFFRNDSYWRSIEGLPTEDEIGYGKIPDKILIAENEVQYSISITQGQKTGYFFDQRINRQFLSKISMNQNILDLFTNQGGFALNAAKGGAKRVLGVDISDKSIESAKSNADLNKYQNLDFICDDVYDFLKTESKKSDKYDIIVCDPPAFAKNKKSIKNALIAYRRVNKFAMQCLRKGGILLTSSCSQHIEEEVFFREIELAAIESKRTLLLIYQGSQSPDHPIIPAMKETKYLKFFGFIVN